MFLTKIVLSTSCASSQFLCTFNMESKLPIVGRSHKKGIDLIIMFYTLQKKWFIYQIKPKTSL